MIFLILSVEPEKFSTLKLKNSVAPNILHDEKVCTPKSNFMGLKDVTQSSLAFYAARVGPDKNLTFLR